MKSFVITIVLLIAAVVIGIYNKQQLIIWFGMNDHEQVAHQFWFDHKAALDKTGQTTLPFNDKVKTFTYTVGNAIEQDGVYYFQSMVFINGQYRLPIFTSVKATNGIWGVDEQATFASVGDASIKYYSELLTNSSKISAKFLKYDLGKGADKKELEAFVDLQMVEIRKAMLSMVQ